MSLRDRRASRQENGHGEPPDLPAKISNGVRPSFSDDRELWSQTISYEESSRLLPWQTDNDHIRTGYRRQIESIPGCIWSAFAFLHNETAPKVNIHSHSIGALFFAVLIPLHLLPDHFPTFGFTYDPLPTPPALHDKLALCFTLLCAVGCLGLSSWFHTVQCHSKRVCDIAHRGDYLGIVILTCGTIISGIYYSFYGDIILQITYMSFITLAGLATSYTVLSPAQRTHRWRRTLAFIALGLTTILPIAHVTLTHGLAYARERVGLDFVIAAGASYIFGALLYAARVPERFSPGTFDYFGVSHQIFHFFVLGGVTFSYAALRNMVWGRSVALPLMKDHA